MASDARLIVVTDIHGAPDPQTCLSRDLPVAARLSLADLCGRAELSGEALHHHLFENDGMTTAVKTLSRFLDTSAPLVGLGYSAGGTALWRAVAQETAPLRGLMCVSSTRLRNEGPIAIPNMVVFGENDPGRPSRTWCTDVPQRAAILPNADHAFYADSTQSSLPDLRKALGRHFESWCP